MTKKIYAVVIFTYSDFDSSNGMEYRTSHYSGTSKAAADVAFALVCDQAEMKTRHINGLHLKPISVTESEIKAKAEDEYDYEETYLHAKVFKDHPYEKEEK